ncbi:hypothetical protein ACLB2K_014621 [Fragaria x ananassa]
MGNRIREEEKIERIIRSLLKLPENKRCINCNSLIQDDTRISIVLTCAVFMQGPQYVCATFLTFVCTNCSGVHREFTHRVKSVSMAKFTAEEVNSLQAGGNERARQVYFKEFDPQHHSFPDSSNIGRLRDFIKHVYVDRKYTGEKGVQKLPKLRLSEEPDERRRVGAYHGGYRSFHDEEMKFGANATGQDSSSHDLGHAEIRVGQGCGGNGLHGLDRHGDAVDGSGDDVVDSGEDQRGAQVQVSC